MKPKKITSAAGVNKLRQDQVAQELEIAARRKRVTELILARVPYSQIAVSLGVSKGTVHSDKDAIMRDLAAATIQNAHEPFLTSLATLDAMQMGLYNRAMAGESEAIALTLRIEQRRAAMLGFDAADRARSGLQIAPPDNAIDIDSTGVLTPDGRPVANRDAARIYAAFASPDTESPEPGSEPEPDGGATPPEGPPVNG